MGKGAGRTAVRKRFGSYRNKDEATQMPLRNPSLALLK